MNKTPKRQVNAYVDDSSLLAYLDCTHTIYPNLYTKRKKQSLKIDTEKLPMLTCHKP